MNHTVVWLVDFRKFNNVAMCDINTMNWLNLICHWRWKIKWRNVKMPKQEYQFNVMFNAWSNIESKISWFLFGISVILCGCYTCKAWIRDFHINNNSNVDHFQNKLLDYYWVSAKPSFTLWTKRRKNISESFEIKLNTK